jgi:hypothetical protein
MHSRPQVSAGTLVRRSVLDLLRRNEHYTTISPLSNRIPCSLVIADGFANGTTRQFHDAIVELVVSRCILLGF